MTEHELTPASSPSAPGWRFRRCTSTNARADRQPPHGGQPAPVRPRHAAPGGVHPDVAAGGDPLARVREALATLPADRVPTSRDWARLSAGWRDDLEERILHLQRLRDNLADCIGCGCLSLRSCACPIRPTCWPARDQDRSDFDRHPYHSNARAIGWTGVGVGPGRTLRPQRAPQPRRRGVDRDAVRLGRRRRRPVRRTDLGRALARRTPPDVRPGARRAAVGQLPRPDHRTGAAPGDHPTAPPAQRRLRR